MEQSKYRRGAAARIFVILLVLIGIMLLILAVPAIRAWRFHAECIGCEQAMKSAGDGLIIDYLNNWEDEVTTEKAKNTLEVVMPARKDLCPAGGTVYLVKNDIGIYQPVCGLHDADAVRRTKLNAAYAKTLLLEARKKAQLMQNGEPEEVDIRINGKTLSCICVTEEEMIHRGTATTNGYSGVVAYYGVAGDFTFSAKTAGKGMGNAKDGEICYFVYADESYCAIWRSNDGWDGDAYQQ